MPGSAQPVVWGPGFAYSCCMARMRSLVFGSLLGGIFSVALTLRLGNLRGARLAAARRGRGTSAFAGPPCTQESCAAGDKETTDN